MTKYRFFLFLLGLVLTLSTYAIGKDSLNAVTMVSYEQGPLDYDGTLALRNNTDEQINNITFVITYLDMSGNECDYEEFYREVTIAPGMTKKIDIAAYERDREYRYYKTKDEYGLYPNTFKIKFGLKGYNDRSYVNIETQDDELDAFDYGDIRDGQLSNTGNDLIGIICFVFAAVLTLAFCVGIYALVGVMARRRNRDAALWVVLSFLVSPLLIIIILLCVGKKSEC